VGSAYPCAVVFFAADRCGDPWAVGLGGDAPARGYPIGSEAVESANQLVVATRLKGAGMHWARPHVGSMVALRAIACSDRWGEAWPQIIQAWRHNAWQPRVQRQERRRQQPLPTTQTRWRRVCTAVSPAGSATCGPQRAVPSLTGLPLAPFPYCLGLLPTAQSDRHCKTVTHTSAANIWGSQGIVIQSVDLQRRPSLPVPTAVLPRKAWSGRDNDVAHRQRHGA
jgi:hypothetical protein